MKKLATALLTIALTAAAWPLAASAAEPPDPPLLYGMEAGAIAQQTAAGVPPDYGTFWVGPWTLKHGWGGPDSQMAAMRDAGVTPAIHFYYWGDDISRTCLESGCWSSLHGSWKDQAGWQELAHQFTTHLQQQMKGEPVVVLLETEFNKADVQEYEPLDGMLQQKAQYIHERYPAAVVVLSLGSWNTPAWKTWDRAAQASDMIGIQGMRGSTRDSPAHYDDLYEATLRNAKTARATFGKDVIVQDLALSSYPEPEYAAKQAAELDQFFTGRAELKAAGIKAIIYRSWHDNPNFDLANYYGQAERHWGLAGKDGLKPAGDVWIKGVKADRGKAAPHGAMDATFRLAGGSNEWWVESHVTATNSPTRVEASHNGGPWVTLDKTSWGTWAKSFRAPAGGTMQVRATDAHGQTATSTPMDWLKPANRAPVASFQARTDGLQADLDATASSDPDGDKLSFSWDLGDGRTASGVTHRTQYAAAGTYTVTLTASDGAMQSTVKRTITVVPPNRQPDATFTVTMSGATATFDARGSSDPDGDAISYTWSFGDGGTGSGERATRTYAPGTYTVTLTVSDGKVSSATSRTVTVQAEPMRATFEVSKNVNQWWVDVRVSSTAQVAKVDARVGSGAWVTLDRTSWGTWAKSLHVPAGSQVTFRATATDGQQATSPPTTWLGSSFDAAFTPKTQGNAWWVEAKVTGNQPIAKVEVRTSGGAWTDLPRTDWGTYAKSMYVGKGTVVEMRATSSNGMQDLSDPIKWT